MEKAKLNEKGSIPIQLLVGMTEKVYEYQQKVEKMKGNEVEEDRNEHKKGMLSRLSRSISFSKSQ